MSTVSCFDIWVPSSSLNLSAKPKSIKVTSLVDFLDLEIITFYNFKSLYVLSQAWTTLRPSSNYIIMSMLMILFNFSLLQTNYSSVWLYLFMTKYPTNYRFSSSLSTASWFSWSLRTNMPKLAMCGIAPLSSLLLSSFCFFLSFFRILISLASASYWSENLIINGVCVS